MSELNLKPKGKVLSSFGYHLRSGVMANSTVIAVDRASARGDACPCGSVNQRKFTGEIGIHFPELKNIDKPFVWVFPELVVCLECGTARFAVPETELRQLARGDAAAAG
jgi:hypothetical protein